MRTRGKSNLTVPSSPALSSKSESVLVIDRGGSRGRTSSRFKPEAKRGRGGPKTPSLDDDSSTAAELPTGLRRSTRQRRQSGTSVLSEPVKLRTSISGASQSSPGDGSMVSDTKKGKQSITTQSSLSINRGRGRPKKLTTPTDTEFDSPLNSVSQTTSEKVCIKIIYSDKNSNDMRACFQVKY